MFKTKLKQEPSALAQYNFGLVIHPSSNQAVLSIGSVGHAVHLENAKMQLRVDMNNTSEAKMRKAELEMINVTDFGMSEAEN